MKRLFLMIVVIFLTACGQTKTDPAQSSDSPVPGAQPSTMKWAGSYMRSGLFCTEVIDGTGNPTGQWTCVPRETQSCMDTASLLKSFDLTEVTDPTWRRSWGAIGVAHLTAWEPQAPYLVSPLARFEGQALTFRLPLPLYDNYISIGLASSFYLIDFRPGQVIARFGGTNSCAVLYDVN